MRVYMAAFADATPACTQTQSSAKQRKITVAISGNVETTTRGSSALGMTSYGAPFSSQRGRRSELCWSGGLNRPLGFKHSSAGFKHSPPLSPRRSSSNSAFNRKLCSPFAQMEMTCTTASCGTADASCGTLSHPTPRHRCLLSPMLYEYQALLATRSDYMYYGVVRHDALWNFLLRSSVFSLLSLLVLIPSHLPQGSRRCCHFRIALDGSALPVTMPQQSIGLYYHPLIAP